MKIFWQVQGVGQGMGRDNFIESLFLFCFDSIGLQTSPPHHSGFNSIFHVQSVFVQIFSALLLQASAVPAQSLGMRLLLSGSSPPGPAFSASDDKERWGMSKV